jgi:hypothetical protein
MCCLGQQWNIGVKIIRPEKNSCISNQVCDVILGVTLRDKIRSEEIWKGSEMEYVAEDIN